MGGESQRLGRVDPGLLPTPRPQGLIQGPGGVATGSKVGNGLDLLAARWEPGEPAAELPGGRSRQSMSKTVSLILSCGK